MVKLVRVAGRPGLKIRKLRRHGLAEHQRPRLTTQGDGRSVSDGMVVGIHRRAVSGRHVSGVEQVFDPERKPVQGSANRPGVQLARLGQRGIRVQVREGTHRWITFQSTVEASVHQVGGAQLTAGKQFCSPPGGQRVQLGWIHGFEFLRSSIKLFKRYIVTLRVHRTGSIGLQQTAVLRFGETAKLPHGHHTSCRARLST